MKERNERPSGRRRFVHLGERLLSIERIRAGTITAAAAADELGVEEAQVLRWMELHGDECLVNLDDLRAPLDAPGARLAMRARRLAALLAAAERHLHELHLELLSKEFGEKSHRGIDTVAHAQPQGD